MGGDEEVEPTVEVNEDIIESEHPISEDDKPLYG